MTSFCRLGLVRFLGIVIKDSVLKTLNLFLEAGSFSVLYVRGLKIEKKKQESSFLSIFVHSFL